MKRKVKIILHHNIDQSYTTDKKKFSWPSFSALFFLILNAILAFSYSVGWIILNVVKFPLTAYNWFHNGTHLSLKNPNLKRAGGFALLVLIALVPVISLQIASEGQKVGGRILGLSDSLLENVNSAQEAIKSEDYQLAQTNFTSVISDLQNAKGELDQSSIFLKSIINFAPSSYNTGNILEAAELLAVSAQKGSGLLSQLNNFRFSPEGLTVAGGDSGSAKEALLMLKNDINEIDANLKKANQLLQPIDSGALPAKYQATLIDSKSLVADLATKMSSLQTVTTLLTDILLDEKRFLVLLQNNNELRATGGFIGTIAQGKINNASIQQLDIRSVYDLDGQLSTWITPPVPMRAVNNRWFMRDANWLANFVDSSQRLSVMYEQEGGETPDLVIAMTPELFIDLLNKTGPITLPTYGLTISASNFVEQIQTTTSVAYDKKLNQPKQLLADLYPQLLQKISGNENASLGILGLLELFQKNLSSRNILLYSRDPVLQSTISKLRWSGELVNSQKDYLQINSSNLGGTKTDRSLKRKAHVITTIQPDGSIINQVQYTVTNPLPNSSGLLNRSFVRYFVPQESRVLAADGFTNLVLPELHKGQLYVNDSVIDQWNRDFEFDQAHNVWLGKESQKMFFGNWLEVRGGESKTVTITYQLPFKVSDLDTYSLYWQRQPGMNSLELSQEIIFPDSKLVWDNLGSQNRAVEKPDANKALWRLSDTVQDQFVGLVLDSSK